jgi:hypothetical protein
MPTTQGCRQMGSSLKVTLCSPRCFALTPQVCKLAQYERTKEAVESTESETTDGEEEEGSIRIWSDEDCEF